MADQLDSVLAYCAQRNPQGARRVQKRLRALMDLLLHHPFVGSMTARGGIRPVAARPYPYAITYRVADDEIIVLGIRHTARQPQT
nr:type II toxin-antitoxin system RelE/ParE family toxin [Methylobacterium sp. GC_Met_2]